jgi:hypothetical protein
MTKIEIILKNGSKLETESYQDGPGDFLDLDKEMIKSKIIKLVGIPVLIVRSDEIASICIR